MSERELGYGSGSTWDCVEIEPDMTVARLIFFLSKSLEVSNGTAIIKGVQMKDTKIARIAIMVKKGRGIAARECA